FVILLLVAIVREGMLPFTPGRIWRRRGGRWGRGRGRYGHEIRMIVFQNFQESDQAVDFRANPFLALKCHGAALQSKR
ncbi:MAG: hypothetical protein V3T62_01700, partial [Alphaproteobacteria bacterium]